jgi:DNA-binding transcriptional MerR regulator
VKTRQYSIEELCELSGFSRRTVRYYVQQGILEPPAGRGRGGLYYDSHLERLLHLKAHQEKGLKLSEIQKIFSEVIGPSPETTREVWVKYPVIAGIEIHISRDLEAAERKKVLKILRIAKEIFKGDTDDH